MHKFIFELSNFNCEKIKHLSEEIDKMEKVSLVFLIKTKHFYQGFLLFTQPSFPAKCLSGFFERSESPKRILQDF